MDPMQDFLEKYFRDENGIIYSQIDRFRLCPVDENTFAGAVTPSWYPEGMTLGDFWSYENCGMTTGGYLSTLCCKLPGDLPEQEKAFCRSSAQRTFRALCHIYRIGSQWEEGFFPKIWGNQFSRQTSTDQYLYAMFGMDQYYPFASEEERTSIRKMIPAMAQFWRKRNYTLTYYHVKDMVWPPLRFPPLLLLAYKYCHQECLKEEALQILSENIHKIPENSRRRSGRLYHLADAVTMDVMDMILMLESGVLSPEYRQIMLQGMKSIWFEAVQTLTPEGFYYSSMPCDPQSGKVLPGTEEQYGARSSWSSMVVRAGLQIIPYLPELTGEVVAHARNVLEKLTPETLYYYHEADVLKLEENNHYQTRFASGDAIVHYLWTKALLENL